MSTTKDIFENALKRFSTKMAVVWCIIFFGLTFSSGMQNTPVSRLYLNTSDAWIIIISMSLWVAFEVSSAHALFMDFITRSDEI